MTAAGAAPDLRNALLDPDAGVRRAAAQALELLGSAASRAA
jgi:HEAT repeat protein